MNHLKVAILGECMVEFVETTPNTFHQSFGGDTLNTAIYLQRLAPNIEVSYLTGLGTDKFSQQMLEAWQQEKINTTYCFQLSQYNPGLYTINVDSKGERSFEYWRDQAAARFWIEEIGAKQLLTILQEFDLIYLSGISLAILPQTSKELLLKTLTQIKTLRPQIKIAFDNNFRPKLWQMPQENIQKWYTLILKLTDYAFLTFDDEQLIWGDLTEESCIKRCHSFQIPETIIKNGKQPCTLVTINGIVTHVPASIVNKVVDTTAAGDSFSAGYLASRLMHSSPETAAIFAHKVAATVIQHKGAIIPSEAMQQIFN